MALPLRTNPFLEDLASEHREWLSPFDRQYLRNWEKVLNADYEAAMIEAGIRRFLTSIGVAVRPNENLTRGERRPDFRCLVSEGHFYVEVTSISIEKATKITGLANGANLAVRPHPLNRKVSSICKKKAAQCSNHDAPVLVAIGTFHSAATVFSFNHPYVEMILTGLTTTTVTLDRQTLKSKGEIEQETELADSAFLKFNPNEESGFARGSISGLLLCGVSLVPMWVIGLLHPNPARPFNPSLLPQVSFGEVEVDSSSSRLRVRRSRRSDV